MNKNSILKKGQIVDHKYTINFFIKKGDYAETYRIQNDKKQVKLLKLFDYKKLHHSQFTENDEVLEIEILKNINHPNILKYYDSGDIVIDNQKYAYLVLDFISGETLAERLKRESFSIYEAREIILGILNGLNYLHNKQILHNEISMQNIMLDLSGSIPIPKIIDFGYSRYIHQPISDFVKEGINPFYMASEAFNKIFSIQSDLFSVGALYYHLLEELPPYFTHNKISEEKILEERKKKLKFSNDIDEQTKLIISKALNNNPENRFQSCKDFIKALNGDMIISLLPEKDEKINTPKKQVKIGRGFSSIAGMQELKDTLKLDVIDALNDKERYKEYGLSIPNGILLYGPPGCGKTFFAEKFDGNLDADSWLKDNGLSTTKNTVLLSAGAFGVSTDFAMLIEQLKKKSNDVQVVVICGKNKKLKNELEYKYSRDKDVKIFGYTENMYEWMKSSSVLITKAGGVTISEALASNIPLILFNPVPGQEMENARYFKKHNMAKIAKNQEEVLKYVEQLLSKDNIEKMKFNMRENYLSKASYNICEDIMSYLDSI